MIERMLFIVVIITILTGSYIGEGYYQEQLSNKDLAIQSLAEYYEDEDRRLLLEANELLRLRREMK